MGFDPLTILTVVGTAVSAAGNIAQANAQAASARQAGMAQARADTIRAETHDRSAEISEINAQRARDTAAIEAQEQDFLTLELLGRQEAIQSASGLTGFSHTRARAGARELGRIDALRRINEGEVEAFNFRTQAESQRSSAELSRLSADNALISGNLGASNARRSGRIAATTSLIGGATSLARRRTPQFRTGRFN